MTTAKIVYVSKTDDGWLDVLPEGSNVKIGIPYGLKVRLIESKAGLDHIEILEGVNAGVRASLHHKPGGKSYLSPSIMHRPGAKIRFDLKSQSLWFNNHGPYNAFSGGGFGGYTPITAGTYQLAIPAFSTKQTRSQYSRWTRYHKTWFRIGISVAHDRFLHPGQISEGCVTVRQFLYQPSESVRAGFEDMPQWLQRHPGGIGFPMPAKPAPVISWDHIYDYLILSRLGNQSVGTLIVT